MLVSKNNKRSMYPSEDVVQNEYPPSLVIFMAPDMEYISKGQPSAYMPSQLAFLEPEYSRDLASWKDLFVKNSGKYSRQSKRRSASLKVIRQPNSKK